MRVVANMNAKVWKVNHGVGDAVKPGDVLLILEAMKMEILVKAPAGKGLYTVARALKGEGELVEPGDVLFALDPEA